jgi:hypothetical protein
VGQKYAIGVCWGVHAAIAISSNLLPAASSASARFSSIALINFTGRDCNKVSRDDSWQFTLGTSSIQSIYQLSSCLITAE